jgi:anti-anti-sigma factor
MAVVAFPASAGVPRHNPSAPAMARVRAERARTVVALQGEWDRFSRSALADALARVVADQDGGDVVIDLAEAEFVDADIVFTLGAAQRLLDRDGRTISFRSPSRLAARVLHLFGLADLVEAQHRSSP